MRTGTQRAVASLLLLLPASLALPTYAQPTQATASASDSITVLNREQAATFIPATVFYRGRTASTQARNSAGLKLNGDRLVLAATVDTSGYSTAIQEKYQAYLITEVPLQIDGHTLVPGAYGMGFIAGDSFVALDLGGNTLLTVPSRKDAALARPNPMQITVDPGTPGQYRLYSGRNYVSFSPSTRAQ